MLTRTLTLKTLLRWLGAICIMLSVYWTVRIVMANVGLLRVSLPIVVQDVLWWRDTMLGDWMTGVPFGGVLIYLGIGIGLLGISSERPRLAFWLLQLAIWCVGINLLYQTSGKRITYAWGHLLALVAPVNMFWGIITLAISLLLFVCYIPLTRFLRRVYTHAHAQVYLESGSKG